MPSSLCSSCTGSMCRWVGEKSDTRGYFEFAACLCSGSFVSAVVCCCCLRCEPDSRSGTLQPVSASWLSEWCIRLVNVLWKRCKRSFYWTNVPVQPSRYFSCVIRRGRGKKAFGSICIMFSEMCPFISLFWHKIHFMWRAYCFYYYYATFYLQEDSRWWASQLVTCVPLYVPPVWPSSPVEVLLWRHVTLLIHLQLSRSVIRFLPHFTLQMVTHLCSLSASP